MKVDEEKDYCLVNFAQFNKNKRAIETDHNALILDLKMVLKRKIIERKEMLNLRNKKCQEAFRSETEENEELLECFNGSKTFEVQAKKWKNCLDNILHKCFKKVRIAKKKEQSNLDRILTEKIKLSREANSKNIAENVKENILEKIKQIDKDIGDDVAKENTRVFIGREIHI